MTCGFKKMIWPRRRLDTQIDFDGRGDQKTDNIPWDQEQSKVLDMLYTIASRRKEIKTVGESRYQI